MEIDVAKLLRDLWHGCQCPLDTVSDLVREWVPPDNVDGETAIEESLYTHLAKHLKGHDIRRQFPHDRVRADILIDQEVAIEIKLNLTTTAEFQRLIGQLECYADWGVRIMVLLVGQVDATLKRRVEKRLRKDWGDEDEARVVHFPLTK